MKICYFSCSTIYGGVEKIVVDTLNEISKNNECCLVVPNGCLYKNRVSSNVKIIEYKSYDKRYNIFLYLELFNIFKNYEVVHSHAAKASQITYILSKFLPFVHIATKHNIRKGKIFNKVKNVISVSNEVAKTITHDSKTLYFGLPLLDLKKNKQDIREEWALISQYGKLVHKTIENFIKIKEEPTKNSITYGCFEQYKKLGFEKAISEIYWVEVESVRVLHTREKFKQWKKAIVYRQRSTKKAYVTLKDKNAKIDFSVLK